MISVRRKVARGFIYNPETKLFLIVKGALPPFNFHLPGGGIDKGESAEHALVRELHEELAITQENIISVTFLHKAKESVMLIPHQLDIFLVTVKDFELQLSWELSKYKWISGNELKDYFKSEIIGKVIEKTYT
ncbi:MAG: NUDIX hydrolase [Patescibacteria group bacterium]